LIERDGFFVTYAPCMPTVAEALAHAPLSLVDDPEGARHVVGLRLHADAVAPSFALFRLHGQLRHLAGDYGPRSVDLPGPVPDLRGWANAFGAKVRARRPAALLRLPAGVLSEQVGAVERSTLARQIRDVLSERLGVEAITLSDIARTIAVHPRTVQRGLLDEGLTFAEILDCVRRERAHHLLTATAVPVTAISTLLGFAEPAVLSRCARRWWGRTPSQVRTDRL
jgi:AraC-like DNA-binding protein